MSAPALERAQAIARKTVLAGRWAAMACLAWSCLCAAMR